MRGEGGGEGQTEDAITDHQIFEAGDVVLQSGLTCRKARLAYKTYGPLNADKSNVIVYPTLYGAQHYGLEWEIGPERAPDPTRYVIVIINKFGNRHSPSPGNTPPPFDPARCSQHSEALLRAQEGRQAG